MTPANAPYQYEVEKKPANRLVLSIVATVVGFTSVCMCCIGLLLGAIAIIFATQSDSKYSRQDYPGAKSSSQVAYVLSITSLSLSALSAIIFLFFYLIYGVTGISDVAGEINSNISDRLF